MQCCVRGGGVAIVANSSKANVTEPCLPVNFRARGAAAAAAAGVTDVTDASNIDRYIDINDTPQREVHSTDESKTHTYCTQDRNIGNTQ